VLLIAALSGIGTGACGGPRSVADPYYEASLGATRVPPASPAEQTVLRSLSTSSVPAAVDPFAVRADPAYLAASGLVCRRLELASASVSSSQRLACTAGDAWFFVPNVFTTAEVTP
jgi:hypothetical protein